MAEYTRLQAALKAKWAHEHRLLVLDRLERANCEWLLVERAEAELRMLALLC